MENRSPNQKLGFLLLSKNSIHYNIYRTETHIDSKTGH